MIHYNLYDLEEEKFVFKISIKFPPVNLQKKNNNWRREKAEKNKNECKCLNIDVRLRLRMIKKSKNQGEKVR